MSRIATLIAAVAFATSSAAIAAEGMECCKGMKECCCKEEEAGASSEKVDHSKMDHSKMDHGSSKPNQPKR